MPSRFGAVLVEEPTTSRFGAVPLEESESPQATRFTVSTSKNPARARRQENLQRGLTPEQSQARREAVTGAVEGFPGFTQLNTGVQQIQTPGKRKEGAHNIITGGGKLSGTFMLPAAIATAPIPTAYAIGTGMVAAPAAEGLARAVGAEPDTAALVGDVTGLVAGGMAGSPGRVGQVTRGAVSGFAKGAWNSKQRIPIADALRGAWTSASEAFNKPAPRSTPRPAPGWQGHPEPTATAPASAAPIESDLPSGRKVPGIVERMERANTRAPKPAPASSSPGEPVDPRLDEIAKSLGAKDFASVPENQKQIVRNLATKAAQPAPAPTATTATPRPAPTSPFPPSNEVAKPEVVAGKPKTIEEMLAADIEAKRAARGAPKAAPSSEPKKAPHDSLGDAFDYKVLAREMRGRGLTRKHVVENRDTIMKEGGFEVDKYNRILSEVSQQEKDHAILDHLAHNGIRTAEQIQAIPDNEIWDTVKAAGYRPKSGAHSRTMAEQKADLVQELPHYKPKEQTSAPPEQRQLPAAPVSQALPETPATSNGGVTAMVRTPSGTKAKVRYRISEMDDFRNSFDEDYNTEIAHQPRDTTRAGSEQRVAQRMSDMDYGAMSQSYLAGDGAPITRVDPATGKSHAVTRNHGTESLRRLYRGDRPLSQRYKADLAEDAAIAGMTPDQVAAMKHPFLHRELVGDMDPAAVKQFADEANMSSTARMSPAEVANSVAGKMTGGVMSKYDPLESGAPNPEFVREILKGLPAEEQGELQTRDGLLNKRGEEMVRNAVFAKAYRSTGALEALAEDPEPLVKNLTTGMLKAAPKNAMLAEAIAQGEAYPLGIGEEVGRAVEIIQHQRENKLSVQDWLNQTEILGRDPAVHSMVDILAGEARRPNIIRDTLNNYVDTIRALGTPKQEGFFGPPELPSKLQVLEESYARAKATADEAAAKRKGKSEGDDLFGSGR